MTTRLLSIQCTSPIHSNSDDDTRSYRFAADIPAQTLKVGSASTCQIQLSSVGVAPIHAIIERTGNDLSCIDLGSAEGTLIDGRRVSRAPLAANSKIQIAGWTLEVSLEQAVTANSNSTFRFLQLTQRPSDGRHYARRFLSQPSRTDGTIEVAHLWRDRVMGEFALRRRDGFSLGSDRRCDVLLEDSSLSARTQLIKRHKSGRAYLKLLPSMCGEVYVDSTKMSVAEALALNGPEGLEIGPMVRARLRFGESIILIHQGTSPRLALPFARVDSRMVGFAVGSALLHMVALALFLLSPADADGLNMDSFSLDESTLQVSLMLPTEEPLPLVLSLGAEAGADEDVTPDGGAPQGQNPDDENPSSAERDGDSGSRHDRAPRPGPSREVLSDEDAEAAARELFAVNVLSEASTTIFGGAPTAWETGYDDVAVAGAPTSRNFGGPMVAFFGDGGLSDGRNPLSGSGSGFGSGGTCGMMHCMHPGFAGPISTLTVPSTISTGPPAPSAADIQVLFPAPSIVGGQWSRAVIQRVIRQNIRGIRACYERELRQDDRLEGRLLVAFTIDPSGNVARAEITESEMGNEAVESCVARRFQQLRFPTPDVPSIAHIEYPLQFVNSGR